MKHKLKNKWEEIKQRQGTFCKMINEADKANQSRAEETDIKKMIAKYGILPFEMMNKVTEPLYLDCRGESLTLNERLKEKERIDKYFENLPAKIRKNYRDNANYFYEHIISGNYDKLINDGIMTKEQAIEALEFQKQNYNKIEKLNAEINRLKGETNNVTTENNNKTNNIVSNVQSTNN